jgi:two-component system, chemotaxis family, protein-glutamate methylesterase/glutaminase
MSQRPHCAVGIGASAGGIEALLHIVRALPVDLDAVVLVVLHIPASSRSLLPQILERATRLPVRTAQDGEPLVAGEILVAPPDRHLLVADGRVVLERGPRENGSRPAVDPLLRSLARVYGRCAVGVVLSGALGDGSAGAAAVTAAGGRMVVQDPADATVPSMPEAALAAVGGAAVVARAADLGARIAALVAEAPKEELRMVETGSTPEEHRPAGSPTGFTCPECHGAIWPAENGNGFRCRVGHAYSEEAFVAAQGESVEAALWTALEVLEERAELLERIARRHAATRPKTQARMESAARDAIDRAALIRRALSAGADGADAFDVAAEEATG